MESLLKNLSNMRGISGYEYRISDKIKELFEPFADEVEVDALGNVIAIRRCKKENAPKIMLEAHMDEIGLMVRDIDEKGYIGFVNIGGVDFRILPSAEVTVHGKKDIPGIIGAKPPHLQSPDEAKKAVKVEDMAIDTGMSYDEVCELVAVGDAVTLNSESVKLQDGCFCGKSMDDRASIAALIRVFERLSRLILDVDVIAVAAVCEEVGGRGAAVSGYSLSPDIAIAIDVTHGITPDNSKNAFELGSGVAIARGPNIHPALSERLEKCAKEAHIKYNIEVEGGDTGTDAWLLQVAGNGIPTALLSIPLRYMHTSVETLAVSDVKAVYELLVRFISELDGSLEGWLCI